MLLALPFLLVDEFLAGRDGAILRLEVRRVWSGRLGNGLGRPPAAQTFADTADLQPGRKTFQITLLFVGEVDGEGFDFHGA
jgi:hypothetical protein